jgi:hypothetical protein
LIARQFRPGTGILMLEQFSIYKSYKVLKYFFIFGKSLNFPTQISLELMLRVDMDMACELLPLS